MAQVWRLATITAGSTYNFLTGTLRPLLNTWQIHPPDPQGRVIESFDLVGSDTTANIISAVDSLANLVEQARLFEADPFTQESVWYEYSADGETVKRAYVHSLVLTPVPRSIIGPILGHKAAYYSLVITRSQYNEDRTESTAINASDLNCMGGSYIMSAIAGDAPARISKLQLAFGSVGAEITKVWAGIRPVGPGVSSFNPIWELEDGRTGGDTALATDVDASPLSGSNNVVVVSTSATTFAERAAMAVEEACADINFGHFTGKYRVLLRCKLGSAGTHAVRMESGYVYGSSYAKSEPKYVDWTSYRFVDLGLVNIPGMGFRNLFATEAPTRYHEISLWSKQVSGTPDLYMDTLVLIPAEHFVYLEENDLRDGGDNTILYTLENGEHPAIRIDNSNSAGKANVIASPNNWQFPVAGGVLVIAGERAAVQNFGDELTVTLKYYPRSRIHRA